MKKIILYTLLSTFILAACSDSCCDCDSNITSDGTGNFRLIRTWGGLWQGMEKPDILDVYFYHPTLAPRIETTYFDTTYFNMPAGKYHILTASNTDAGLFAGMEDYATAQIVLPVEVTDSNIMTCEAPLNLSDQVITVVTSDGQNECIVTPAPVNQVINFRFNIQSPVSVTSCRATLDGVQISKMLYIKQPAYTSARLPFEAKQIKENDFYKSLSILGLAPGTVHLLTVKTECTNGISQETIIDLTDKISFQSSPVQNCTVIINMNTNHVQTEVTITDWEPGTGGNIEFH